MAKALVGIRVPDSGRPLAGSNFGTLLADAGAEVVKIELPDADPALRIGQHICRVPAEAHFGPAESVELAGDSRQRTSDS